MRPFIEPGELEWLSSADRQRRHALLLDELVRDVRHHPLVADRLACLPQGLDADALIQRWVDIPPADSTDHREWFVSRRAEIPLLAGDAITTITFSSGGSTGTPKVIWLTFEEVMINTVFHGKGYHMAGIRPEDVVATFGLPGNLSSEFTVYHGLDRVGCAILPIGTVESPSAVVELIRALAATVLLVMPSDLIPIIAYLEDTRQRLDTIRLLVTGGEALSAGHLQRFSRSIGAGHLLFGSTFQTSDAGTIGYQCPHCRGSEYHIHEELHWLEILPLVEAESASEIVTTNLHRRLMPVIRQRTGDLAEWVADDCPCGRRSRRIRLLGRTSQFVKVGGEKLDTRVFQDVAAALGIAIEDMAVVIDQDEQARNRIVLCLAGELLHDDVSAAFVAELHRRNEVLNRQIRAGIVSPIVIRELRAEDLRFSSTGKRVVVVMSGKPIEKNF